MCKKVQYFLLATLFLLVQAARAEFANHKEKERYTGSIFVKENGYEKDRI